MKNKIKSWKQTSEMLLVQSVLHSQALPQFLCRSTRVVPSIPTVYLDYMEPLQVTVSLILHVR